MKLGIVYKDNKIINHRSLIKVLFNPILRIFGYNIVTEYDSENNTLGKCYISNCDKLFPPKWEKYNIQYDLIKKERLFI